MSRPNAPRTDGVLPRQGDGRLPAPAGVLPASGTGGFGNRLSDTRTARVTASPEAAFAAVERIGGANGWYAAQPLWEIRGWLDVLFGGIGMRRGRRDRERLEIGDVLDCWRVEALERNRLLVLTAEMKLPGRAWLEYEVRPDGGPGISEIRQAAIFDPRGLVGQIYWYALWPIHDVIFARMLRGLARYAERHEVYRGG